MLDEATGLLHDRYLLERGERIEDEPWTPTGFSKYALESRESLLVGENIEEAAERLGSEVVAGSESVALENARLVHETRQRNAELALINGVQDAIAGELDPQAIYDAVGDRIRELFFDAQVVSIRTFDEATGLVHFPYV